MEDNVEDNAEDNCISLVFVAHARNITNLCMHKANWQIEFQNNLTT